MRRFFTISSPAALVALLKGELENFKIASTPGGIEASEEKGNQNLRNEKYFPKRILHSKKTHADLEKEWNVKFEEIPEEEGGDIFYKIILPLDWDIKPSKGNPHYWSNLVDNNGKIKAHIFYKAAFYDRSSHAFIEEELKDYEEG